MTTPYMEAERRCYGSHWDEYITILMCDTGTTGKEIIAMDLDVPHARTLANDILALIKAAEHPLGNKQEEPAYECGDNCKGECSGEVTGIPFCPNTTELKEMDEQTITEIEVKE
jgi:hypothetical protein